MKKLVLSALIGIFALTSGPSAFAAKIAFVDVAKVFDDYQKTKDQDMALKGIGEQKESERNALVESIRKLEDEIALLSRDARASKEEVLIEQKRQLEDFDREARRELGEQRNKVVKEIFDDIDSTIAQYGADNGYDFILNERVLLYQNDTHDITEDVLGQLSKTYKN